MEQMGVISKVTDPTPWCAGMVVVPKKSGKMRICVDLKPLNENVLREPHPIPKVDDVLGSASGSQTLQQARRKQRLLEDSSVRRQSSAHYFPNTVRKVPVQQTSFRDFLCSRTVSA